MVYYFYNILAKMQFIIIFIRDKSIYNYYSFERNKPIFNKLLFS